MFTIVASSTTISCATLSRVKTAHRFGSRSVEATAKINRHDFGVSWQDEIPGGGVVVSNEIQLVLDVEAILLADLERTGAIESYPNQAPSA